MSVLKRELLTDERVLDLGSDLPGNLAFRILCGCLAGAARCDGTLRFAGKGVRATALPGVATSDEDFTEAMQRLTSTGLLVLFADAEYAFVPIWWDYNRVDRAIRREPLVPEELLERFPRYAAFYRRLPIQGAAAQKTFSEETKGGSQERVRPVAGGSNPKVSGISGIRLESPALPRNGRRVSGNAVQGQGQMPAQEQDLPSTPPQGGHSVRQVFRNTTGPYSPNFVSVFWESLPRWLRQRKAKAFREWTKAGLDGQPLLHEEIRRALKWQRSSEAFERDNRGKITAASYLRGQRWEDESPAAPVASAPASPRVTAPPSPREPWPERTTMAAAKPPSAETSSGISSREPVAKA